jgi:1-acyl-sn-glycerol-3-phosphate acyltransferase
MSTKRRIIVTIFRFLLRLLSHWEVHGSENLPQGGPLLVVFNHIAHLDGPLVMASLPWEVEGVALADLYDVPVTGQLLRLYGTIPIHRDVYDREIIRRALQVLGSGRVLAIAPEARMSPTFSLERGRSGAAYLALRAQVPILPIGLTGTETVISSLSRLRRPHLTVSIGPPFVLEGPLRKGSGRRPQLETARDQIMQHIAALLPAEYRGVYA